MLTSAGRLAGLALAALFFSLTAQAQNTSTTVLTSTPSTLNQGESVALTVAVQVAEGDPVPTGTVAITLSGTTLLTVNLNQGVAETTASTAGIVPGKYTLVAQYSGDANTAASHSTGTAVTLNLNTTTTTLTFSSASVLNRDTVSATVAVNGPTGGKVPTGTITFMSNGNAVITATLVNGKAIVSAPASKLADGVYPISAVYSGDAYNSASTSATQQLTVYGDTSIFFTISPAVETVGAEATVSVVVTGDGPQMPTGTVSFYFSGQLLANLPLTNGTASFQEPTTGLAPTTYALNAKYSGDANNNSSTATANVHLNASAPAYTITPAGAVLAAGREVQFVAHPASSTVTWYVNDVAGGTAATGTISSQGYYTAPAVPVAVTVTASEASTPGELAATVPVYVVVPGTVSKSNNPQVASYSIGVPPGGNMFVDFGPTTSYGLNTWTQPTPAGGGTQTMLVAGMAAPATYHMQATVSFCTNLTYHDADQTFNTTLALTPPATAVTTVAAGMTPQPGIEIANTNAADIYGYDMAGNFVWGMSFPGGNTHSVYQGIKQMSNGHLLVQISPESAFPVDGSVVEGDLIAIFEYLLDGTVVKELTIDQLNANLAASGYVDGQGNVPLLYAMHHDVTINPVTGHWIVLSNTIRTEPETTGPTAVLGDVVLDVDPNNNFAVGWVWNSFDNLDVNRHPDNTIQDWTHANAVVYSATDHNLLISMRYQNWVLKLDYNDGAGAGDIIWHFGYEGDFTLLGGTSPQDWVWGQHEPAFTTTNTTGVFGLALMDNGLDRPLNPGYICQDGTATPCHYSRAPQFTVDETAMTATLGPVMPYDNYSYFGGNGEILPNGDAHADFCVAEQDANPDDLIGTVEEYTGGDSPQFVWSLNMGGPIALYRSHRWTSLYPGVTWTTALTPAVTPALTN